MSAVPVPAHAAEFGWSPSDRGRVGMYCLIAAEAAIFTIFVVAYLFYVGKSLAGPTPKDVLHFPVALTICLLSSSISIHLAIRSLRSGRPGAFARWWFVTLALGDSLLVRHGDGMAAPDLRRGSDDSNQPVWNYLLLSRRTACFSRGGRADRSVDGMAALAARTCQA